MLWNGVWFRSLERWVKTICENSTRRYPSTWRHRKVFHRLRFARPSGTLTHESRIYIPYVQALYTSIYKSRKASPHSRHRLCISLLTTSPSDSPSSFSPPHPNTPSSSHNPPVPSSRTPKPDPSSSPHPRPPHPRTPSPDSPQTPPPPASRPADPSAPVPSSRQRCSRSGSWRSHGLFGVPGNGV